MEMFSICKETSSSKIYKGEITAKEYFSTTDKEYQLVLVVRSDLQMTTGEVATRCSSASLDAFNQVIEMDPEATAFWNSIGKPNVVLQTDSVDELKNLNEQAKETGLITSTVNAEGDPNNVCVVGIGPGTQDILIPIIGHLKLL